MFERERKYTPLCNLSIAVIEVISWRVYWCTPNAISIHADSQNLDCIPSAIGTIRNQIFYI